VRQLGPVGGATGQPSGPAAPTKPFWTPEDVKKFYEARDSDVAIRDAIKAHPEWTTLADQIAGTAALQARYFTIKEQRNKVDTAMMLAGAKMTGPQRIQFDSLDNAKRQLNALVTPGADGRPPVDVLPEGRTHNVIGQIAGGPGSLVGQFLSPAGAVGTAIPGFRSIPEIAQTQGDPDQAKAIAIIQSSSALLPILARATSISGRLTNTELGLMRDAFLPTPGVDTISSAVTKIAQGVALLTRMQKQLATNQLTPWDVDREIRLFAGVPPGPVGPDDLSKAELEKQIQEPYGTGKKE
jgi:hypothetical protein